MQCKSKRFHFSSHTHWTDNQHSCLTSGKFSDLTIKCRNDVYKVHKMIVCTRAGFFAGAMRFGGQVRTLTALKAKVKRSYTQQEAQQDVVDLSKDEPQVIASLVRYLYSDKYDGEFSDGPPVKSLSASDLIVTRTDVSSRAHGRNYTYAFPHTCAGHCTSAKCLCPHHICNDNCKSSCRAFICDKCCSPRGSPSQLLNHSKMYVIADKYDVAGLKQLARKNLEFACTYFWNDDAFPIAIDHIFSATVPEDIGMRSIVIQTISKHMALVQKPEIQALITTHGDLAIGVLLKRMG